MNEKLYEDIYEDIMVYHYGEGSWSLAVIANKHGVKLADCEDILAEIKLVTQHFKNTVERGPSVIAVNKIKAYAREHRESIGPAPFWRPWLKMATLFASLFLVTYGLLTTVFDFKIGFDDGFFSSSVSKSPRLSVASVPLSVVSIGNGEQRFDDDLDQKMHTKTLSGHEIETVYFRARKREKLGHYKEALQDYTFLTNFYPDFAYGKYLPLNLALCHEMLGDKKGALAILGSYQKTHGGDKDITLWIDRLKSVTF